ncbi:MAG: HAMP domain-containing histidine kinase [Clostridiales bacterium]|nr:HAMP domain-containing histidine kinase [Clostridiales bacterium]
MKSKNGMVRLRKKIVITFIWVTLLCGTITEILDLIFASLQPLLSGDERLIIASLPVVILFNFLAYVSCGLIFYIVVRSAIRKESERQVKENNLMYAAVAHDLKTPLTSIQGFAKALEDGKVPEEEKKEISDIIAKKSERMNELVDLLFEYSQLGTAEYKPNLSDFDIAGLMRGIIAENYSDLEDHKIEVDVHIPDTPVIVNADKRDITRALSNLVINTYKHNPDGITFYVRMEKTGDKCEIILADTGNDIPEGMNIFEPFVTENTARSTGGGTGLGLALTKRIIDRYGGTIALVHDVPGYTKAFKIRLKCR